MKLQPTFSLRMGACALALLGASFAAQAQTQPAPAVSDQPAVAGEIHKQQPKRMPHHDGKHKPGKQSHATPKHHAADDRHAGTGPVHAPGAQHNQFERNALQRCEIFKTDDDRRACVERVRQPQLSGTVEGGGVIREYTQTIQVPAASPSHHQATPAVPQTPHMMHPPVAPMRK